MVGNNPVTDSSTGGYLTPTSVPPEDDDVLASILHDLVCGLTGLNPTLVFPRWQPQPPTMPHAHINWGAIGITSYEPVGNWPEMDHYPGYSVQKEHQLMEVVATFYGPSSGAYASMFFAGLTVRQNLEVIGASGIMLRKTGGISRVPELVNTQYIPRSDVSFTLVREIDRTYAIKDIDSSTIVIVRDDGVLPVVAETDSSTMLL